MNQQQIERLTEAQRQFFNTGATLPVAFRKQALVRLRQTILQYQEEIIEALQADLCKSPYESFMCEIGLVLQELRFMLKHIQKFARSKGAHLAYKFCVGELHQAFSLWHGACYEPMELSVFIIGRAAHRCGGGRQYGGAEAERVCGKDSENHPKNHTSSFCSRTRRSGVGR